MKLRPLIGISVLLMLAMPAVADLSPPVWLNHSSVTTLLDVAEPFTDYAVFRVSSHRATAPGFDRSKNVGTVIHWEYSAEEVAVVPAHPVRITGDIAHRYSLFAVPRSAIGPGSDPKNLISAVDQGKVPGAARLSLDNLESWEPPPRGQSELIVRYRLERTSEGVVFTRMTADGSSTFDNDSNGRPYRWIFAGVFAAAALVAVGLWWAWRGKAKTAGPSEVPEG